MALLEPRHKLKQGFNAILVRTIAHGLHESALVALDRLHYSNIYDTK